MGKALIIVESPAKAKMINRYLDNDYVVKSSVGHIRGLPTSGSASKKSTDSTATKGAKKPRKGERNTLVNHMGVGPWHDWDTHYEALPDKEKVVSELKQLTGRADRIYLVADLNREGETIAWHLREVIGGGEQCHSHVVSDEITENAIRRTFEKPGELNIDRVNVQQARRFMDRTVGYMVSPLLWKKTAHDPSAGRVQPVVARLVVECEREVKAFVPEEYWEVDAGTTTPGGDVLPLQVTHKDDKSFHPASRDETMAVVSLLEKASYSVLKREDKPTSSKPGALSIISTLQQAASTRFGFGVKKTMTMAQRFYGMGYITHIHADSTNLSQDTLNMVHGHISDNFGKKYLPENANQYVSKEDLQEAHETIHPSDVDALTETLKDMEVDTQKLYQLVWRQFVACQMTPAQYDSTMPTVAAGDSKLKARGCTLHLDGWAKAMPTLHGGNEDRTLPVVKQGDHPGLVELTPVQHFTKLPVRLSEASPVKELEKRDIGRPSTCASIISTIQDRGYVQVENRRFYAGKIGEIVTDRLEGDFRDPMNYDLTAQTEDRLDQVANHQAGRKEVLNHFFDDFTTQLETAGKGPGEGGMQPNLVMPTSIDCPTYGRKMGIRTASAGVFLDYSGYALSPRERCKTTIDLVSESKVLNVLEGDDTETSTLRVKRRCQKCGTAIDSYLTSPKYKLRVCNNSPTYDGYEIEEGEFHIKGYDGPIVEYEKYGSEMHLKIGRLGKYMACTNDECRNMCRTLCNGKVVPPRGDPVPPPELPCEKSDVYFVLHDGAAGVFLAANTFPKSRETHTPLMEELYRFCDRLPEKLRYLADVSQQDPESNKALVRFSCKTKQQYMASEEEGKATGRSTSFIDGKRAEAKK